MCFSVKCVLYNFFHSFKVDVLTFIFNVKLGNYEDLQLNLPVKKCCKMTVDEKSYYSIVNIFLVPIDIVSNLGPPGGKRECILCLLLSTK